MPAFSAEGIGRHRSNDEMENTHRPAPGMIGRTGEFPLGTARFSDSGCNPQRWASISRPVFGSVARGEATESSDVDFLVELELGRSLFDLGGLLMDLQGLLHRNVDVVTERGLRPRVAQRVLADAIDL